MVTLICKNCGHQFEKDEKNFKSRIKQGRSVNDFFCSTKCGSSQQGKERGGINGIAVFTFSQDRTCDYCFEMFNATTKHQRFCSTGCSAKWHQKKNNCISKICEQCGCDYKSSRKDQRFCSKKCSGYYRKKNLTIPEYLKMEDKVVDKNGYIRVYCPIHPKASSQGYVYEHRILMEIILGRLLNPNEIVHHKNGKRQDNRLDNLEVMDKIDHAKLCGQRLKDLAI